MCLKNVGQQLIFLINASFLVYSLNTAYFNSMERNTDVAHCGGIGAMLTSSLNFESPKIKK